MMVLRSVPTLLAASPSVEDLEQCWCHHRLATATKTVREVCDCPGSDSVGRI